MSVEKINEITEKAENWVKSQSTGKLKRIKKNSVEIKGNTFDEELQIKWTIIAVDNELYRRLQEEVLKTKEEVLKTKEEILSIFK
jgi:hypothetical protein